jgi:hypothetical protein
MKKIVNPFFLYQMGWIKLKTISRYCLFNQVWFRIIPSVNSFVYIIVFLVGVCKF